MHPSRSIFDDDEPEQLRDAVSAICAKLKAACGVREPEAPLLDALSSIASRGGQSLERRLSRLEKASILYELTIAKAVVPPFVPDYPRAHLLRGIEAAEFQVIVWGETSEERAARPAHTILDANDYARIFQNDMHNRSLLEGIAGRAYDRRADEIEALAGIPTRRPVPASDGIFG